MGFGIERRAEAEGVGHGVEGAVEGAAGVPGGKVVQNDAPVRVHVGVGGRDRHSLGWLDRGLGLGVGVGGGNAHGDGDVVDAPLDAHGNGADQIDHG